ncbi:MAG: LemA family protein, partial [Bacilli bacterium]
MFFIYFIIFIAFLVFIGIIYVIILNNIIKVKNWVDEAWAQIDVQLQRRNDLIPNLVETVKGYANHEQETLTKVIEMRNIVMNTPQENHQDLMQASNQLSSSLKSIFALAESYPDLKANQNF